MSALAPVIALAGAVAFAGSTSLQHNAAQQVPPSGSGALYLIASLLRRPVWVAGQVLAVVGLGLHSAALDVGSIAVVQPIVISGVVLAVPVRSAMSRRWPDPRELLAVAITAAGLTVFLIASSPSGGTDAPVRDTAVAICLVSAALAAGAVALGRRLQDPTQSAFLLGIASGILFGVVAGLIKAVVDEGTHHGPLALLTSWSAWTLLLLGVAGVVINQQAYRLARLSASMPVLNVVDGVVSVLFGVLAYHEVLGHSPQLLGLEVLAFAAVTVGLVIVARLHDVEPEAHVPATVL